VLRASTSAQAMVRSREIAWKFCVMGIVLFRFFDDYCWSF
jgi:hypothetical protein